MENSTPSPVVGQPVVENTQAPVSGVAPKPKSKFPVKALVIVLAVILLAFGGYFAYTKFFAGGGKTTGEITWWGLWEDEAIVKGIISDYENSHPGVTIKYVRQSKVDYRERLTNALAKGTGPDIFRFHNSWVPMFKNDLDSVPASVYSASDFTTTFFPVAVSDLSYGTGILGVPLEYDGLVLYINEDIFEKSGKSIPTTWVDLRQTAKELTVIDDKGTIIQSGVALGRTENVDHWQEILALLMLQNGVNLNNPTGKLAEDALSFYTLFNTEEGIWDTTLPSSTLAFSSGKLAMYFGPSWRAFEIRQQNPNLRFKTVPVPQLAKTERNEPDVSYASYWVEGVWSKSKNKDTAWDFVKFLSSNENLTKFYDAASKTRMFGEPYPKVEMASTLSEHPIIGAVVNSGSYAQSWFLQSRTWDGPTGINSQISKYFEDAINSIVIDDDEPADVLPTVAQGVSQVLSAYGIQVR